MGNHCDVFVSVGSTCTDEQEAFVCAVEARLRAEALTPHTVGRDTFSSDAPLKAITGLMDTCSGAVVIAFERTFFAAGVERRGGRGEKNLASIVLPTPWNQVEAAMAYSRRLPLLVILQKGLKTEGLLDRGYDWYVQEVDLTGSDLHSLQFNGVLASWKEKLNKTPPTPRPDVDKMTTGDWLNLLRPAHLWTILVALVALVSGAFAFGIKLGAHALAK